MKSKAPCVRAVDEARCVLADACVVDAIGIDVEAIAGHLGVWVLYGALSTAVASIVRAGNRAVLRADEASRGWPRWRFSVAHELAHFRLHASVDHYFQCVTDQPRTGRDYRVEREACEFATELLMPERLVAPSCAALRPTVDDVERLALRFRTSLQMTALRFVELATAPCAVVKVVAGRVKRATESASYSGRIVGKRKVDPRAIAARVSTEPNLIASAHQVPGDVWGSKRDVVEHVMTCGPHGVLTWVVEAG